MKKTKINYDKKKDILYIFLRSGVEEKFEDLSENITVEYDKNDKPIGIEIFNTRRFARLIRFPAIVACGLGWSKVRLIARWAVDLVGVQRGRMGGPVVDAHTVSLTPIP